jgi:hypothetical protein
VPPISLALFIEPLPYFSRRIGLAFKYDLSGILSIDRASSSAGCRQLVVPVAALPRAASLPFGDGRPASHKSYANTTVTRPLQYAGNQSI